MDGAFGRPAAKRSPAINITPLIDVMFLLLIFFMVSSTFNERLGLDVALPESTEASPQDEAVVKILVAEDGEYGYGEDRGLDAARLEAVLRDELQADPEAIVSLSGDMDARYESYIKVLDILQRVGATRVKLNTEAAAAAGGE